jgi:DNA-binding protein
MDVTSILSMVDSEQLMTIIVGIFAVIGYVIAAVKQAQKKNAEGVVENTKLALEKAKSVATAINNFFTPDVPMDAEQEALITEGVVTERSWKMETAMRVSLFNMLIKFGASCTQDGINSVVDSAEAKGCVEYGILVEDHDGNPATSCKSAFVTYGAASLMSYSEVQNMCASRANAPLFVIGG